MIHPPYHPSHDIHANPTAARDLTLLFVGKTLLGRGQNRWVYDCAQDPTCVIKYEPCGDEFQNVLEWRVWQAVKNFPRLSEWFAPCVDISGNGQFLIQRRIEVLARNKYPKKIPDWFGDTKYVNFGMWKKRFVACDYGVPSFSRLMYKSRRLTHAGWIEEHS